MAQKPHRIVQIHVTRKCNLKCLHCYSASGPDETEMLDIRDLKAAITDAHHLGYTFITLSGGEPFLYPDLEAVLAHAKGLGLQTGLVTNGMFLDERRLAGLVSSLDLIVVSLDGAPARHNRMRLNASAFEVMARKLPNLRKSGIAFGFLFTLSRENAQELDWAAEFAAESGASMLQVHPLETEIGRAAERPELAGLDPTPSSAMTASRYAWAAQKRLGDKLRIIVDFRPRMPNDGDDDAGASPQTCDVSGRFCDVVPTLCIETDGAFTPMGHGFSREFLIGHLGQGRLLDLSQVWKDSPQAQRYLEMVKQVRRDADQRDAPILQNIAQTLRRASFGPSDIAAQ